MSSEAIQPVFPDSAQGIKQRILHGYCVRVHMALIVTAVVVSGVLSSKLLLGSGVHSLRLRYPVAVAVSYGVFLLLIRVWIWYVTLRRSVWSRSSGRTSSSNMGGMDFGGSPSSGGWGGGGGGRGVRFGGGSSGGGGASDAWGEADSPLPVAQASSGHGSFFSNLDFGGDDDGWLVMVLLIALVLAIFGAGGYLVFAAPQILPEAACQAILAPALLRVSKEHHHGWMSGVLRSTVLPFAIVCVFAGALGWAAHRACPTAPRLIDVWSCPTVHAETPALQRVRMEHSPFQSLGVNVSRMLSIPAPTHNQRTHYFTFMTIFAAGDGCPTGTSKEKMLTPRLECLCLTDFTGVVTSGQFRLGQSLFSETL